MSPEVLAYLQASTAANLKDDESAQAHWQAEAQPDPYRTTSLLGSSIVNKLGVLCHAYLGWRAMLACAIVVALPISIHWPPIALLLTLFAVLVWRVVPTTGHP